MKCKKCNAEMQLIVYDDKYTGINWCCKCKSVAVIINIKPLKIEWIVKKES